MPFSHNTSKTRRGFMHDAALMAAGAFAAGIRPIPAYAADRKGADVRWFDGIYRQLHLDAHFGGFKNIYLNFDAEGAAQLFDEAGVQMVSYFAKCWGGYSYYPTEIGLAHPGLDRDFTGEMTAALKKRGIRCIVYFMMATERQLQKAHPEWVVNTDPSVQQADQPVDSEVAIMCFKSPYVDEYAIPQMKEIVQAYDVDGFFLDIIMQQFLQWTCYCPSCRELYRKTFGGEIPKDDSDPGAFAYRKWSNSFMEKHMAHVQAALGEVKRDIEIINNYAWMIRYPVTPPKYVHHITWDTPTPKVGNFAWNFSNEARYVSTLPDITWSCMNTRGNNWMDYSLREPEAFLNECATLLAAGGGTYLSDIPYPHGNPDPAVMKVFGDVNRRTQELEPFLTGCTPVKDTAVLHSADSIWSKNPLKPCSTWIPGPAYFSVNGAHKALIEGHVQMGILNSEVFLDTIDGYGALILADQRILSDQECEAVRRFVRNGGALIATAETATRNSDNLPRGAFGISDVLGVDFLSTSGTANGYLRTTPELSPFGIPEMDVQVMGSYTRVAARTAQTLLELVPPYEGIKSGTPPPDLTAAGPGVTMNSYGQGKAVYCAVPLFSAYYSESTPVLRNLALWMLELVYPRERRTIALENTPINVEVFYNERGRERFIHLVNYSGDKRETGTPQVQDFTTVHGCWVSVRLREKPARITSVPGGQTVPFRYSGGWASFEAEPLHVHSVYRIDG